MELLQKIFYVTASVTGAIFSGAILYIVANNIMTVGH